jgi:hypothetical protein
MPPAPPDTLSWLFWDVDVERLDVERHADYILGRVLERGRLSDVHWALEAYGSERILQFLREAANPELSARTIAFWRAFFREDQAWRTPPAWRTSNSAPWPD